MILYADILAGVAGYLQMDEDDTELSDKFDILNKANDAQRAIARLAPVKTLDEIIKTVTGNLQQDIAYYQWPDDYVRFADLFVDFSNSITDTNQGVEAIEAPSGVHQTRSLDKRPDTYYPMYSHVGGGFELRPIPTSDLDDGFMLRYIYRIPDMVITDPTQDCLLKADLLDIIVNKTVSLCAAIDDFDIPMSERFEKMFMDDIKAMWGTNIDFKEGGQV